MKMTSALWKKIKHFNTLERWGDPGLMDRNAVFLIDFIRDQMDAPCILHCAYDVYWHKPPSQHCKGKAVDCHFVGVPFRLAVDKLLWYLVTCTVGMVRVMHPEFFPDVDDDVFIGTLVGFGIYPHWNNPGIHLDTRGERARWGAVNRNGKQTYVSFDEAYQLIGE